VEIASATSGAPARVSLAHVRIVLVGTTHPGNIGATARAMKTMGLADLYLVEPARFPAAEATARAAGADDILGAARVHQSLSDAVHGCNVIYGTTARSRRISWPTLSPRDAALEIATRGLQTALVFGRERAGLSNEELDLCQHAICIETDLDYSSLNLAQAVQICAYELRIAHLAAAPSLPHVPRETADEESTAAALEQLRTHCLAVMERVAYYDPERPKLLDRRLRRLINRAGLRHSEVQIVRGVLSAIEARLDALEAGRG
jgi:tRNA (cytidine32/uridine32-2'-O)-methyltransferase